jgi:hypothetical protein
MSNSVIPRIVVNIDGQKVLSGSSHRIMSDISSAEALLLRELDKAAGLGGVDTEYLRAARQQIMQGVMWARRAVANPGDPGWINKR